MNSTPLEFGGRFDTFPGFGDLKDINLDELFGDFQNTMNARSDSVDCSVLSPKFSCTVDCNATAKKCCSAFGNFTKL